MSQITVLLPDALAGALDAAVRELSRSRADLVREAIERFLEDIDDLSVALERLRDPSDPVLGWDDVRRDVVGLDAG
ncbi:MAG: ribbon-helix-helix protein, CopG family [Spirochaetaceae bacterium]|nr:ribbon-helix-helix protein, CopG family [Spirochaetaceae bacterium]